MSNSRLAVGIPTYQEADSIGNVARQVDLGLACLADPANCVIINVDSDSPDKTAEVFLNTPTCCRKESLIITEQPRGKGRNLLRFFERCVEQGINALAIVDGDLRSITPDWIEALLAPVLRGEAEYVAPLYLRHRFDGSMTNNFAFPMMFGYFGTCLRQPVGGEFAFSVDLVKHVLKQPLEEAVLGYGIDIFLSMHAVGGGFRVAQTKLGRKLHNPSFPKWNLIQPQAIAAAIATARLYPIRVFCDDIENVFSSVDDTGEYRFYEETQALLANSRARARDSMPVYRSWLGDEASRLSASFENGENGGTTLSANSWTDLLAACVARAVWIEPQIPARFFADHLIHALYIRTITHWNATWKHPIEEFNDEINLQARLLREKLLSYARTLGQSGVTPSSA